MKKHYLISVIITLVVAAGAFWGGTSFAKASVKNMPNLAGEFRQFNGGTASARSGANGGALLGRGAMGQILSVDGKTMTVSIQGGGSKLVLLSDSTKVSKTAAGSLTDLIVGANVVATGTTNSDGSLSATDIQLRPEAPQMPANGKTNANRPTAGQ